MPDGPSAEKVRKAKEGLHRSFLRSARRGEDFRPGSRREFGAVDIVVQNEFARALVERDYGEKIYEHWPYHTPPRALSVKDGYWIVYRRPHGGPPLTLGTAPDATVARAVINRIEAEGDTILTGKTCKLCDTWMYPKNRVLSDEGFDKDSRDATLKLIEIGVYLTEDSGAGYCSDCWNRAYERAVEDPMTIYKEEAAREKKEREAKFAAWRHLGRAVRRFMLPRKSG